MMKFAVFFVAVVAVALCAAETPSNVLPPPTSSPPPSLSSLGGGHVNPFTLQDDQLDWKQWPYCVAVPPENNEFLEEVEGAEFVLGRNDGTASVALQFAQTLLNSETRKVAVTGVWDEESIAALKQVQRIRGLALDGLLTPYMWQFLFGRGIFAGDQGYQAYAVWALLKDFYGYPMTQPYAGYDDKMVDAVADFQLKMGLVELCCSERQNHHECHEFSEGFRAGHLIGPRFLEMLTLSVGTKQQGTSLLKSLEDTHMREQVSALSGAGGSLKTASETIHNVRVAALQRIVADSLRGANGMVASGVASVGVQSAGVADDNLLHSGHPYSDDTATRMATEGDLLLSPESGIHDGASTNGGGDNSPNIMYSLPSDPLERDSGDTDAFVPDNVGLLQVGTQTRALACSYQGHPGSCLTKSQCDALPGRSQTVALWSSKDGAKGCEEEVAAIQCCVLTTEVQAPALENVWKQAIDPRTNRVYYYNLALGESRWDNPDAATAQTAGTETTQAQNNWMTTTTTTDPQVAEEEEETEPQTQPQASWAPFPEGDACTFHEEKGVCMKVADCSALGTAGHPFMSVKSRLGAKGCETKPSGVRCCVRNMGKYALLNEWDKRQSTTVQTPWFGLPEPTHLQKRTTLKLWATTYYTPIVEHSKTGVAIKDVNNKAFGAKVDKKMFCLGCSLQGSCVVKKGGALTTYSYVKAGTEQLANCCNYFKPSCTRSGKATFHESSSAYGSTSRGLNVTPLRTIAVDPTYIPYYSVVYIPAARGKKAKLFDGTEITHDGYFYAVDTGGAIHDKHIDVYYGPSDKKITAPFDFIKSKDKGDDNFTAYIIDSVEAFVLLDDTHRAT